MYFLFPTDFIYFFRNAFYRMCVPVREKERQFPETARARVRVCVCERQSGVVVRSSRPAQRGERVVPHPSRTRCPGKGCTGCMGLPPDRPPAFYGTYTFSAFHSLSSCVCWFHGFTPSAVSSVLSAACPQLSEPDGKHTVHFW